MSYLKVTPDDLQTAAPSFKSSVVGDANTQVSNVTNALTSTLNSISVVGPFASQIEEIITGIQGLLECLDNSLNRAYIGLGNAGTSYSGTDSQLANTLNQVDSTLSVFLGFAPPRPPPSMPKWVWWGGLIASEIVIDGFTFGAATPEEVALDGTIAAGEVGIDALTPAAAEALEPSGAQLLRELYGLAA